MRFLLIFILSVATCSAQTVSYWFQGWQKKPDAEQAAAYFMVPGANVTFTYANNRVVINSAGGVGGTIQLFGDVTSPLTALPNVTTTLGNVDVSHLNGGIGAGPATFWCGNGTWATPGSGSFVLKAGDTMTGPLLIQSPSGIVVSNSITPTALFTGHGMDYIGNNDPVYVANDNFSGLGWWTIGVGAYPGGAPAMSLDLNGTLSVAGGFVGDGNGLTNLNFTTTGISITQYMTDFMLGQITNVYSNGLLVATGLYSVPVTPLLGAGGDALIGAGGDAVIGAGG